MNAQWPQNLGYTLKAAWSCHENNKYFTEKVHGRIQNILINIASFILFIRGDDFRKDYSQLPMLFATFPRVPVVALTATASKADVKAIKVSLNMKKPLEMIGDPNRANIFYEKVFCKGDDIDFFKELLKPMASKLKEVKLNYPLTILYLPLKWCGFAFKFFWKTVRKWAVFVPWKLKPYLKIDYSLGTMPHWWLLMYRFSQA